MTALSGERQGGAVMCEKCHGVGLVVGHGRDGLEPIRCKRCGVEGLEPVTLGENMEQYAQRTQADLSLAEKREILELTIRRHTSQAEVAKRYGVSRSTVSMMVHNHRKAVMGGMASLARAQAMAAPPVTIRHFSWEAEA